MNTSSEVSSSASIGDLKPDKTKVASALLAPLAIHFLLKFAADQANSYSGVDTEEIKAILAELKNHPIAALKRFEETRRKANQRYRKEMTYPELEGSMSGSQSVTTEELDNFFRLSGKQARSYPAVINGSTYKFRIDEVVSSTGDGDKVIGFDLGYKEATFNLVRKNKNQSELVSEVSPIMSRDHIAYLAKPAGLLPNAPVSTKAIYIQKVRLEGEESEQPSPIPIGPVDNGNLVLGLNLDEICSFATIDKPFENKLTVYLIDMIGKIFSKGEKSFDQKYTYRKHTIDLTEIVKLVDVDIQVLRDGTIELFPWKTSETSSSLLLQIYYFGSFYTVLVDVDSEGKARYQNFYDLVSEKKLGDKPGQFKIYDLLEWKSRSAEVSDKFLVGEIVGSDGSLKWVIIDSQGRFVEVDLPADAQSSYFTVDLKKTLLGSGFLKPRVVVFNAENGEGESKIEVLLPEYNKDKQTIVKTGTKLSDQ